MTQSGTAVQVRHIVWDWNGTLLDDNHVVMAALNVVCEEFGRAPVTLPEWQAMFRRPIRASYEELLGRTLDPPQWAQLDRAYHGAYRARLAECGLADGAVAALDGWRANGGGQSLLSMWFHDELLPTVERFGLTEFFTRIDGLRDRVGGGSKAEHLARHVAACPAAPEEIVVIGDVADDAEAAAQAGVRCVLVSTGMATRRALLDCGVPVVESIPEAVGLFSS